MEVSLTENITLKMINNHLTVLCPQLISEGREGPTVIPPFIQLALSLAIGGDY